MQFYPTNLFSFLINLFDLFSISLFDSVKTVISNIGNKVAVLAVVVCVLMVIQSIKADWLTTRVAAAQLLLNCAGNSGKLVKRNDNLFFSHL